MTGIVTSVIYLSIQILEKEWSQLRSENEAIQVRFSFLQQFRNDTFFSEAVIRKGNKLEFWFKNHQVRYEIGEPFIIKSIDKYAMTDSLQVDLARIKTYKSDEIVNSGHLDRIELELGFGDESVLLIRVGKIYSIEQHLKYAFSN